MNGPLRRVAAACLVLFFILLVNANYVQVVQARSLREDSHNGRQLIDRYRRERGPIIVDGQPIAQSVSTNDSLKYLRRYPFGSLYSEVTGYYSLFGRTRLEQTQDELLSGDDPRLFTRHFTDLLLGHQIRGGGVTLTLSSAIQRAAVKALGHRKGAVVALDPRTGAILAVVSYPSYDPNALASHDGHDVITASDRLNSDPAQPLLDRALEQRYPPGSLFKVVTAATALSSGRYTPQTSIPSPDRLKLPLTNLYLQNFAGESCDGAHSTLADALRISCNTAFAGLGLALGDDAIRRQARAFGIGRSIPDFPLQVAESVFPSNPDRPQTALSAIGQYDVALTPMQAAMIAAAVANKGALMRPYLISRLTAPDLSVLETPTPSLLSQAVTEGVAGDLAAMMEKVVESGTGTAAAIPGVRVAGKTGTAQNAKGRAPHAWFIGFAPVQDPIVAVAVVVESGEAGSNATGGTVAAPIARAVIKAALSVGR